jgi:acetyl-CoA acetyltransferase
MPTTKGNYCFVGIGATQPTRRLDRSEVDLAIEACRIAADDAGIDPADVDGINIQVHHYPPPETEEIARGFGMREVNWMKGGGGLGIVPAGDAAQALEAGNCKIVVVCKIMNTIAPSATPQIDPGDGGVRGPQQFTVPYGVGYTRQTVGLFGRRYMHERGYTPEQLAWIPVTERAHAQMNPGAYMYDTPMTMEDYFASRYIAEPVRLFDCDIPVNRAVAYIMTSEARAKDLKHRPVYLRGWAGADNARSKGIPFDPWQGMSPTAQILYKDSRLSPEEIDLWFVYDGYSFLAFMWLENLGVVKPGEAGPYIEGGDRIRFDGEHPMNTHGGNLSEGRSHGAGHILEVVRQMRGEAGDRQVSKADHAILSSAFPYPTGGGCGIISKEP